MNKNSYPLIINETIITIYRLVLVPYINSFKNFLSPLQFLTLCIIDRNKDATITSLSNSMNMPKQNMTKIITKLEELELKNLKLIRFDATNIDNVFDKEIDRIYLNFSDPWPKERHAKRRLTSPNFLKKYELIFKDINHITMKTDNRKLFEYSIKTFNEEQYNIENISLNLYDDDYPNNIPTEYEIKFKKKGYPIYMIDVKK